MKQIKWSWKIKYLILFLWIFLFSCKTHQTNNAATKPGEKAVGAVTAVVWQWVQHQASPFN